ncbi:hypothetical protein [Gordonia sp. KTR9]|uniref:hypothetical protein n=1 Tax=Gordonia sp. KTR9 TaxID=337191 RepID=UPI00027DE22A|nr:hypothetical protein [Gordonia sp. KTR9]AFR49086.1 hypothetical protein KTR9_2449 [Gordonia sp. KTR9]
MVLPLIPLVAIAVGAAAGGGGVALGGKGAYDIKKAKSELDAARSLYESRRAESEALVSAVNDRIVSYGTEQETALRDVVLRMHDFLIRNEKKVRDNEKLLADGLEASVNLVAGKSSLDLSAAEWVRGVISSVATGVGTSAATTTAISSFGVASTGAAISGLSGAAAESATLAWLGGGALAAGGGGVALGALALNFVTFGPGLLAAGFVINGKGKKASTQAREYQAKIAVEIEKLGIADTALAAVEARVDELSELLADMSQKATDALDELEAEAFDPEVHAPVFQQSMILVKAVMDIATTPVLDEGGELTDAGHALTVRYRPADTRRAESAAPASAGDTASASATAITGNEMTND